MATGYRRAAAAGSTTLSDACGALHRRLHRVRLAVVVPSLLLAFGAGAVGVYLYSVDAFGTPPGGARWDVSLLAFAGAPFFAVLGLGLLLNRAIVHLRRERWIEQTASATGVDPQELREASAPFFDPPLGWRRQLRWALMWILGLLALALFGVLMALALSP